MDDCLSLCRSSVGHHCHVSHHVGDRVSRMLVIVVVSVVMDYFRFLVSIGDQINRMLVVVVGSVVMDDCQLSCQSSLGRHVGDRVSRMLVVVVGSVVMDDCLSSFGLSCR